LIPYRHTSLCLTCSWTREGDMCVFLCVFLCVLRACVRAFVCVRVLRDALFHGTVLTRRHIMHSTRQ
jgi:hypothetical protein